MENTQQRARIKCVGGPNDGKYVCGGENPSQVIEVSAASLSGTRPVGRYNLRRFIGPAGYFHQYIYEETPRP